MGDGASSHPPGAVSVPRCFCCANAVLQYASHAKIFNSSCLWLSLQKVLGFHLKNVYVLSYPWLSRVVKVVKVNKTLPSSPANLEVMQPGGSPASAAPRF